MFLGKNKLNIYITGEYIFSSEIMILSGLLEEYPKESINCYNHNNIIRYGKLKDFCKEKINLVDDPEKSDILVLPYKFKGTNDLNFKHLETLSEKHNKKLLCFYNDDDDRKFNIGENTILYRTSFYKSSKLNNEKPLIAIATDFYKNIILEANLTIGYCGHLYHGRENYIKILKKSELDINFIIRQGFWAPGVDKKIAIKQYFENMENNLFIFCYRGGGNFSYRFYETLMMGRIPIVIDTDCVFPFEEKVKKCGLFIDEKDIKNSSYLIEQIKKYYENNKENIKQIQLNNRKFWEDYYSPVGFTNNLISELCSQ